MDPSILTTSETVQRELISFVDPSLLEQLEKHPLDEEVIIQVIEQISKSLNDPEKAQTLASLDSLPKETVSLFPSWDKTWNNQLKNQVVEPLKKEKPASLRDIQKILESAVEEGLTVKAAGSGHSYSDVATTNDCFIDTHALNRVEHIDGALRDADLHPKWRHENMKAKWKPTEDLPDITHESSMEDILLVRETFENNTQLFETEAGITIHDLNLQLAERKLALPNMGGYDGQTIIGVVSTSTHGSGINLGPFPDMVQSFVLATTGTWNGSKIIPGLDSAPRAVKYYRIERTEGISDPELYKKNLEHYIFDKQPIQLIQDDDCFNAAIVSLGTMGVIYSVVLQVMQCYYLTETRVKSTLKESIARLQPTSQEDGIPEILKRYRNFEILVNPYRGGGKDLPLEKGLPVYGEYLTTVETRRNITPRQTHQSPKTRILHWAANFVKGSKFSYMVIVTLMNYLTCLTPSLLERGMRSLCDTDYVNVSYEVYNLHMHGDAGFATEIGFPLQHSEGESYYATALERAVDQIIKTAQLAKDVGKQFQTSPFSLRFVKASPVMLSMMNGVNTVMIEMPMVTGSYAGQEILRRQQLKLYSHGGRPHWGLEFDNLTGSNNLIENLYPMFPKWKKVYDQFNEKETFNNKTTNRLGFSVNPFER